MASMRDIKLRIKSVKETRQITNAMKLISAAKLKKARQQLEETLPYFDKIKTTIADILLQSGNVSNICFDKRSEKENKKKCFLILTGDKGLAGGYNHNILKLAEHELESAPDSLLLIPGVTGRNYFIRKNSNVLKDFDYPVQNPTVYRAREISDILLEMFKKGEVDEVYVIYTKMVSSIKLEPQVMKLLPLDIGALREDLKDAKPQGEKIVYEPSLQAVYDVLIPKYVKGIVYGTFVEAFTSEQSSRMTAMDNATSNADEVLQKLNLYYNRARQASITQEITEIVGGASALQ